MERYVFERNRKKILNQMEEGSVLLSFSTNKHLETHPDKFDVNRNYYYVSGVFEYENIVMLVKGHNNKTNEIIFINPYDELKAKWVGAPLSPEEIYEISGITDVRNLENFDSTLTTVLASFNKLYLDIEANENLDEPPYYEALFAERITKRLPYVKILNGRALFQHARTIKEPEEIEEMKKAIEITNKGIINILKHMGPQMEYQLESYFDQAVKYYGGTGYSFPTIAASGANSCCLHYSFNNSMAEDGDLILFDLGASLNCYCADISRTFPVNGKFTPRQRQIYNIVLNGQKLIFDNAKPGITTRGLNQILRDYYKEELYKIGLIKEKTEEEVSKYYYHGCSHHIGIDCHDLCDYTPLQAGSIISNEPGLYIAEEGIGIRIEDDILITEDGAEWLSPQIIKEPDEIEKFIEENK
ncbi:MAG: aminopeptidase P N-terminal domain-containing protein [Acholeplasmatales bacterium]|nr:aminopeptidase P N-terminal domain-containing protein [Acholeplasmatales bacterium]